MNTEECRWAWMTAVNTKIAMNSGNIICKECGGTFRRQKIYIGKPYEKIQWCCITHIENSKKCTMKAVRERGEK